MNSVKEWSDRYKCVIDKICYVADMLKQKKINDTQFKSIIMREVVTLDPRWMDIRHDECMQKENDEVLKELVVGRKYYGDSDVDSLVLTYVGPHPIGRENLVFACNNGILKSFNKNYIMKRISEKAKPVTQKELVDMMGEVVGSLEYVQKYYPLSCGQVVAEKITKANELIKRAGRARWERN